MNEVKVAVLGSKIVTDEILHETVSLLDSRFTDYKELGLPIPKDVQGFYSEVQRVSRLILKTENHIVAMALGKKDPVVMLVELDMKHDDSVYGATKFETNDESGVIEYIYLEKV